MPPLDTAAKEPQCATAVLMVRPARFSHNPETAASNAFQRASPDPGGTDLGGATPDRVRGEFDALAQALTRSGVTVVVADDTPEPVKPDAVFPNNWVSFHHDGTVVVYPMLAVNRRAERREAVLRQVVTQGGYRTVRTVDLSHHEVEGRYLEGTGSLVLDRAHRVAYAGLSPRTQLDVLGEFAQLLDYELVTFDAADAAGRPVYHTNVLMAVGADFAVLCGAAIVDASQRAAVAARLRATGHELIDISPAQMHAFSGNILQLETPSGPLIAMSATAWGAFTSAQRRVLETHGSILAADIPLIERLGGGSVRCMLAEIHLPKR